MVSPRRKRLPLMGWMALSWFLVIDVLTSVQAGPISLSGLFTIATALLCVWYLALIYIKKHGEVPRKAVPWPLVAFLLLSWVQLLFGPSLLGVQNVAVYTGFIGAMLAAARWAPVWQTTSFLRALRLVAITAPLIFLIAWAAGVQVYGERAYALTAMLFTAVLIPYRGQRLAYKAGPYLVVATIFLSLSRTAAIIAAVLLVFTAVRSRRRYRVARAAALASVVGVALFWAVTSYAPFRDRFLVGDQALAVGGLNISTSGRSALWGALIDSAAEAPWFGHGPGSSNQLMIDVFDGIAHPHNDYLRLYHDSGIVGASLFTAGLLILIYRVWLRVCRTDDQIHWVAFLSLLGGAIAAVTDNVIVYAFVVVPLGVIVGCSLAQPVPTKRRKRRILPNQAAALHQLNPTDPSGYNTQRPKEITR
ncbi:O-antigen ligase family protein [Kocuria sediminis]|nr:O-antigen ligase family protein [Kocuria sediminis]